jgi:hypothetical protein
MTRTSHARHAQEVCSPRCGTVRLDRGSAGGESKGVAFSRILPSLPVPAMDHRRAQ